MFKTDSNPRILSIVSDILGHRTYGLIMKEYFETYSSTSIDFYRFSEERELVTRLLVKPLHTFFPNQWIQKQNLDFHRFRVEVALAYLTRRLIARKVRQKEYSSIFLHTQVMAFLSISFMKKLPTVVSLDMTEIQASQENTSSRFRWTFTPNLFLEKRSFEMATQIITWSEWARKSVIEDYQIDPEKVKVIYPGVNINNFILPYKSNKELQKRFSILFVGGDFKRKGGQDLLEVFLETFSEQAELKLVTHELIKSNHSHVHIYNNVKAYTHEWLDLYQKADVFIMPTYWDAYGYALVEAMVAGLPIIATRINAIPEIVSQGETGFLIQPGDRKELANKIRHLIENPDLCREMGIKGRKSIEKKFSTHRNFQNLETIFREISLSN